MGFLVFFICLVGWGWGGGNSGCYTTPVIPSPSSQPTPLPQSSLTDVHLHLFLPVCYQSNSLFDFSNLSCSILDLDQSKLLLPTTTQSLKSSLIDLYLDLKLSFITNHNSSILTSCFIHLLELNNSIFFNTTLIWNPPRNKIP